MRTFADWAEAYCTSRVGPETRATMCSHILALLPAFGECDPATIAPSDAQEWIATLTPKPSSVRRYMATLLAILDCSQR